MIRRLVIGAASTALVMVATALAALLHLESYMEATEEDWL